MAKRLDHGKAKRRRRFGERVDRNPRGSGPSRSWRNLRTEWDGPDFPVTLTRQVTTTSQGENPDD